MFQKKVGSRSELANKKLRLEPSLNPTLRPNLRPNSDDSLCHVIDSFKIFGSVRPNENKTDLGWFSRRIRLNVESCSHQNLECANSNHEIPSNIILNRFFFNSTLWKIRCSLNPKAQAVNKVQRQLRPYFPEFFKSWAQTEKNIMRRKELTLCHKL